jgi:hypothetical protein
MMVIRYHVKSYCNMLLPHLTTFNVQSSLEMPITTFPALGNPNVCAVFKSRTKLFLYIEFNITFPKMPVSYFRWRLITHTFYAKYQVCKSPFEANPEVPFHSLITISEKCYCSQALCTEWAKPACAGEQGGWWTVLKVGKFDKPNCSVGIHDFIHELQACTHSALSASYSVHWLNSNWR